MYEVDEWSPYAHGSVSEAELPEVYARINAAEVSWEGDTWDRERWRTGDCIIVHVYGEWSFIVLKHEDTFYYLTVSGEGGAKDGDPEEEVELPLGGQGGHVRRKYLAPRELGLAVLSRAGDTPGLLTDYVWTAE